MYLKKAKRKNGRIYLSIAEGYHDPAKGHTRTVNVQSLGYVDVLAQQYADPLAHFQKLVEQMNAEKTTAAATGKKTVSITLEVATERIETGRRKNFGYAALSVVYHELDLDSFFANRQQSTKAAYSLNAVMRLLVFSRLLAPGSKKKAYEARDWFFERGDYTLDDVYRALTHLNAYRDSLQVWIHEHIVASYGRDTSIAYYDVTNYYFEIDEQDTLRKKGVSKEHRTDPIIQMGLFMDNSGLPVAYQLFPGNNNDCTTLLPIIKRVRREYGLGKAVVVSDKGMNSARNAYYLSNERGGYVFSQSVRGGTKELKAYVLKESGYKWIGTDYKQKSRQFTRHVEFEEPDGRVVKAALAEKQVVFYSRDYDRRAKADRAGAVSKAREIIKHPAGFNKHNTYGAAKYVRHIEFDKQTGEIIQTASTLAFNEDLLKDEEQYDGYYVIVTSRHQASDEWIIDTYKGLWRIEETFRVTKSDLEARPVYVSREDHIQAHFLTCFVALVIARLLQVKTANKFSVGRILEGLSKTCCSHVQENLFVFDHFDEATAAVGTACGVDFSRKFRTRAEIKNIIAQTKKS